MSQYFAQLSAAQDSINAAREQLKKDAQKQLKPALVQFLKDNPKITKVRWRQYTPYFNDGDACEFSVREPYFYAEGVEEGGDYEDGGHDLAWRKSYSELENSDYAAEFAAAIDKETFDNCKAFAKQLRGFSEALEAVFGDHAEITVTRDGVDVEEYSHD